MWQDSLKPALWRWMVGTLIALGYAVLISSCTPDEVTIRPSHIAAETAEESDAAEKMPIAHLPTNRQRVLLIAQHTTDLGAVSALTDVYSAAEVAERYGAGSQAHLMADAAIKAYANAALSIITLADNSAGVAAAGKITITGKGSTTYISKRQKK